MHSNLWEKGEIGNEFIKDWHPYELVFVGIEVFLEVLG
jgi:hypothetical protein